MLICPDRALAQEFSTTIADLKALNIVGEVKEYSASALLDQRLNHLRPDLVLLDTASDRDTALRLIGHLVTAHPAVAVIGLHHTRDSETTLGNGNLPLAAIRQQIAAAVDLIVQVARLADGSRRVTSITEVTGMEVDVVTLQDLFVFEKRGISAEGKTLGRFAATGIRPKFYEKVRAAGIPLPQDLFESVVEVS